MTPWLAFLGIVVVVGIQSVAMAWLWYKEVYRDGYRAGKDNSDGTYIKPGVLQ